MQQAQWGISYSGRNMRSSRHSDVDRPLDVAGACQSDVPAITFCRASRLRVDLHVYAAADSHVSFRSPARRRAACETPQAADAGRNRHRSNGRRSGGMTPPDSPNRLRTTARSRGRHKCLGNPADLASRPPDIVETTSRIAAEAAWHPNESRSIATGNWVKSQQALRADRRQGHCFCGRRGRSLAVSVAWKRQVAGADVDR